MTDDEYVSSIAKRQRLLKRLRRPIGMWMVLAGLLTLSWSSYRVIQDIKDHFQLIGVLEHDSRHFERDREQTLARVSYRFGVLSGFGICSAMAGGGIMVLHGLCLLLGRFRKERLLVEAYGKTDEVLPSAGITVSPSPINSRDEFPGRTDNPADR